MYARRHGNVGRSSQTPEITTEVFSHTKKSCQEICEGIVECALFEFFIMGMIMASALLLGLEAQIYADEQSFTFPIWLVAVQHAFTLVFFAELLLRLGAQRYGFFCDAQHRSWNIFDVVLVACSMVDTGLQIFIAAKLISVEKSNILANTSSARIVRVVRITRIVSMTRVVRLLRFVSSLRLLVVSILATIQSLGWAMVFLGALIYVFAIYYTVAVTDYIVETENVDPRLLILLDDHWKYLHTSMFTLFKAIASGISWSDVVDPLKELRGDLIFVFIVYMVFTYFAVLNVMTGVFCQSAIEGASKMEDQKVKNHLRSIQNSVGTIKKFFETLDTDGSGAISIKELRSLDLHDELRHLLAALDMDCDDISMLFKLLDADGSESIDFDEFVAGCVRLKGQAKTFDLLALRYEHRWIGQQLAQFMDETHHALRDLLQVHGRLGGGLPESRPTFC